MLTSLRAYWALHRRWLRPLLLVAAAVLVVLAVVHAINAVTAALSRHHGVRAVEQTMQGHAQRQQADRRLRAAADSQYYLLDGQRRQAARTTHHAKTQYEERLARLPAAPELPLHPPRYRPASGTAAAR